MRLPGSRMPSRKDGVAEGAESYRIRLRFFVYVVYRLPMVISDFGCIRLGGTAIQCLTAGSRY